MLAQPFQKFRLLVIELLDRFGVRFAFPDHLPDLVRLGATLTFFRLCRAVVQTPGYCPPHDATSPNRKTCTGFQLSIGTVVLFGMCSNRLKKPHTTSTMAAPIRPAPSPAAYPPSPEPR